MSTVLRLVALIAMCLSPRQQPNRPVVERSVGHVHAREAANHALEFVYPLKRSLTYLGLVRRVGGVELTSQKELVHECGHVMSPYHPAPRKEVR